jgi:hypothetical protein
MQDYFKDISTNNVLRKSYDIDLTIIYCLIFIT